MCGYEETVQFPASGHCDEDLDGIFFCDICYQEIDDAAVPQTEGFTGKGIYRYEILAGRQYRFRCIDEDYSDMRESGIWSTFLCETVIRSDIVKVISSL